jgi:phosphatidylglycerophosphate synthase
MISHLIARLVQPIREGVARALLRLGLRPNHVTVLGMLLTVGAGVAMAAGKAWWPWAVGLVVAAGGCDMLDGAMAQRGGAKSPFGGVLDSICDRASDGALYLGPALYFAARPDAPAPAEANLTLVLVAGLGLVWAYLVSYVRARAERVVPWCGGGFWQRGERVVTIILGLAFGHLVIAVWILGLWPLTTVAHRLWRARRACEALDGRMDESAARAIEPRGLAGLLLWRWERGTVPFDLHAGAVIAMLVFVNLPEADPLRSLLARLVGA